MKKKQLLRKRQYFLCLMTILLCVTFTSSFAAALSFPEYGASIDYGRGVFSAQTQGRAICYDAQGNPELCYGVQGGGFYALDLASGKVKFKQTLSASQLGSMVTAADGKVYFNPYPQNGLCVYDPVEKTIRNLPDFDRKGGFVRACYADPLGTVYFGVYHEEGGYVLAYDTKEERMIDYGVMREDAHYIQGIYADENYIYAGVGVGTDIQSVIRCDKHTGEKVNIGGGGTGSTIYYVYKTNRFLVTYVNSGIVVFDAESGQKICTWAATQAPDGLYPEDTNLMYTACNQQIVRLNLTTHTREIVATISEVDKLQGMAWAQMNGEWVLEFHSEFMDKIGYYCPKTGRISVSSVSEIADSGPAIQSLEISPDHVIYMGGYQTSSSAWDIDREKFVYHIPNWTQTEGAGFLNGKTYFGTYTDAVLYRYDPQKPVNFHVYNYDGIYQGAEANPSMVYDIGENQDRPFVVKGASDKLYVGTMPGYGYLGGALTIYEEDEEGNPTAETYSQVIPNQSISGIAIKDHLVYLSGTVRGGLGIKPTETQAKIAVFDTEKKEVVVEAFAPDLPIVGKTSQTIGELSFGPDGLLWGVSEKEGLVFAMDPDSFEVKKYVAMYPNDDRSTLARPLYLRWSENGLLYTTAGWRVSVINPDTMEFRTLVANCSLMTLDADDNVWYVKGSNFFKLPITEVADGSRRLRRIIQKIEATEPTDYYTDDYEALRLAVEYAKTLLHSGTQAEIVQGYATVQQLWKEMVPLTDFRQSLHASIEYAGQTLSVSGENLRPGMELGLKVCAPNGKIVVYDQPVVREDGGFEGVYRIDPIQDGLYSVYVNGLNLPRMEQYEILAGIPDEVVAKIRKEKIDHRTIYHVDMTNYQALPKTIQTLTAEYVRAVDGTERLTDLNKQEIELKPGERKYFAIELNETAQNIGKVFLWDQDLRPLI